MSTGSGRRSLSRRTIVVALALAFCGLFLFVVLIVRTGADDVAAALAAAGWGLLIVVAFHLVPLAADTMSWARLIDRSARPSFVHLLRMRWIGESVNTLLPAAQVGGDIVRARLATFDRVPGAVAGASVVADLTLGILSQAAFTLIGLALLMPRLDGSATDFAGEVLVGIALAVMAVAAFYAVQRVGLFGGLAGFATRIARHGPWVALADRAGALDRALDAIYRRPRDVGASFGWTLVSWVVGAGEVWIAFQLIGTPVTMAEALIFESVAQAVRSALFVVPGALGVQEGGILVVAVLLSIPPDAALAMSLAKRARELFLGLPGLIAWQAAEGRRLWRRQG